MLEARNLFRFHVTILSIHVIEYFHSASLFAIWFYKLQCLCVCVLFCAIEIFETGLLVKDHTLNQSVKNIIRIFGEGLDPNNKDINENDNFYHDTDNNNKTNMIWVILVFFPFFEAFFRTIPEAEYSAICEIWFIILNLIY